MSYIPGALLTQTCSTYGDVPGAWRGTQDVETEITIPGTSEKLYVYPQTELKCEWDGKTIQHAAGSLGGEYSRNSVALRCLYVKSDLGEWENVEFLIACDGCWRLGLYDSERKGFMVFNDQDRAVLYKLNGEQQVVEDVPRPLHYPIGPKPKKVDWLPSSPREEGDLSTYTDEKAHVFSSDTKGEEPSFVNPKLGEITDTETPAVQNNTRSRLAPAVLAITALALAIILGAGGAMLLGLKLGAVVSETYFFYIAGGLLGGAFLSSILTGVALWRRREAALKFNLS